jgi:hypothetical protein
MLAQALQIFFGKFGENNTLEKLAELHTRQDNLLQRLG